MRQGADYPPLLGVWNGAQFTFTDPTPVGTAPTPGGFSASVDRLGLVSGATVGLRVGSIWVGYYDDYVDFAPEASAPGNILLPVIYSTVAPPPVPVATPVPVAAPAPPAAPAPVVDDVTCTVPKLKGRSRGSAEDRLLDANCEPASGVIRRYSSSVRTGRVIGSSPAMGTTTTRRVKLIVSKGRKRTRARASVSAARSLA